MQEEHQKILIIDETPANIQMSNEFLQSDYDIFFSTNGLDRLLFRVRPRKAIVAFEV